MNLNHHRTIRPLAVSSLHGITFLGDALMAIDKLNGYLLKIDPVTDNTTILNPDNTAEFIGATGLAIAEDTLWFTRDEHIYSCSLNLQPLQPELFIRLYYPANDIAVIGSTIYVTCAKAGQIIILNRDNGREITRFYNPGIGEENITIKDEELWLSDDLEQTVYCLDRATGEVKFRILTPFESPTGLVFYTDPATQTKILYVAYNNQEPYIRDNPNSYPHHEIAYRHQIFIHPLHFQHNSAQKYTLSNGYLVEMSYVEELSPLDNIELEDLEWRIALPAETLRQKIRKIEPIGLQFNVESEKGQKVAVFKFDHLNAQQRYIFGWKATLEVWSIKYNLTPLDCENLPPLPAKLANQYLLDDDDLAMDTEIIRQAATEAVGRETNLLRKMYSIRNYVYDRLSYGIKPQIDTPDVVLARGVGSCGEYLGVLLALARLNGIACRTVGRYKCPQQALWRGVPLIPDFNHVWMEFYVPGIGWLPMESNPDDIREGGPYPTRFFMGLAWYHAELAKEVPFSRLVSQGKPVSKETVSIADLAINHVRFIILEELSPA